MMLAIAFGIGVHRRGGRLAVALLHGSLVLMLFAHVEASIVVQVSLAERFAC